MPTKETNGTMLVKWVPVVLAIGVAFGGVAMVWGTLQTKIENHDNRLEKAEDRIDKQTIDGVRVIGAIEQMNETLKEIKNDLKGYQKENNDEHRSLRRYIRRNRTP